MNIAINRKYHKRRGVLSALFVHNPVLVLGLDLPFVIVCATSLRIAVALSVEMLLIHMVTMTAALITVRFLPSWARMLVNVGVAFVTMTVARSLITNFFPDLINYAGMYVYLMAVNGITIYQSTQLNRRDRPIPALIRAALYAVAFGLIMVLVSVFREWATSGTVWGIAIGVSPRLSGLGLPFSGFVIMGFLLAFTRLLNKKLTARSIVEAMQREIHYTSMENILPEPLRQPDVRADASEEEAPVHKEGE